MSLFDRLDTLNQAFYMGAAAISLAIIFFSAMPRRRGKSRP
jgi:hypothetical protein